MRTQTIRTVSLLLLAACNPGEFQEYLDTAPIRVASAPEKFRGPAYGQAMVTVSGDLEGKAVSRIVVAGASTGKDTRLAFVRGFEDGKISESTALRCSGKDECKDSNDVGSTLIPFASWGTASSARHVCVYAPGNATNGAVQGDPTLGGNGYIACDDSGTTGSFTLGPAITKVRGADGALRFSGFGLPAQHPLGVLLIGVHAINASNAAAKRSGNLYVQLAPVYSEAQGKDVAPFLEPLPLEDPATGKPFSEAADVGDLGAQVAGAVTSGKNLLIAISQPSKQRVLVASYDDSLPGDANTKLRLHACINSPDAALRGFGERVLVGDLTGDGAPEIVIGADPASGAERKQGLYVYDGRSLPGPVNGDVCPPWAAPGQQVVCAEKGVSCEGSAFGSSIALGDVNADGKNDLIIGAPLATVRGNKEVGAVWIIPGGADGLAGNFVTVTVPGAVNAHFGWNVAALRTNGRDEPVVSAPGVEQVFTLMCTPLESGYQGDDLCLE